ncbi:Uncharacterized protein FWK35_00025490 [Aphis craccivora]|uniref:Uncharacterized protein n=1 Tax=Aphis craccivora TaxID=307492 RepID=A0A6G0YQ43_APHCR|nr:Uncharacterized protein FWK35_00025490 [Aphis craccivora]
MRSRSWVTGGTTTTTIALAPAPDGDDDDDDDDDDDYHHHHDHCSSCRDGPRYRIIVQRPAADAPPPTGRRRPDDREVDGHGRGDDESLNDDDRCRDGRRRRPRHARGYTTVSTYPT